MSIRLNDAAELLEGLLTVGDGATLIAAEPDAATWPGTTRLRVQPSTGAEQEFTPVIVGASATWSLTVAQVAAIVGTKTTGSLDARITTGTGDALRGVYAGDLSIGSRWSGRGRTVQTTAAGCSLNAVARRLSGSLVIGDGRTLTATSDASDWPVETSLWIEDHEGTSVEHVATVAGTLATWTMTGAAVAALLGTLVSGSLRARITTGTGDSRRGWAAGRISILSEWDGVSGPQSLGTVTIGPAGQSAYDVAVAGGFVGNATAWLASLVGAAGAPGVGVPVGGTTGQVLAKTSATDYDAAWIDPPAGGSTAPEVRSALDSADTAIHYIGTAPADTAESSAGWTLTRITVAGSGAVTTATASDTWTNREDATYG